MASEGSSCPPSHRYNQGRTYHGDDDSIVILAQTPPDHQSRSGAGYDKAEADDVERDRDDNQYHSPAMETNISLADDPLADDNHDGDNQDCDKGGSDQTS